MIDSSNRPAVALIAVGTEITTGQILNSNAATISQKLTDMGFEVRLHLCVADSRPRILWALDSAAAVGAQLIIVTGGLGPTSDDFTRDVIAEWFGLDLAFDEDSWQQILNRLNSFGIQVAESNRKQCFFPRKSLILKNSAGTANGFWIQESNRAQLVALPGPPREIDAIWQKSLQVMLPTAFSLPAPDSLLRLQCVGKSESAIGEMVEEIIKDTKIKTGYRPHVPFVEVKLWIPHDSGQREQVAIVRLRDKLKPWVIAEDDQDLVMDFVRNSAVLKRVVIIDSASQGILEKRLSEARARFSDVGSLRLELIILERAASSAFQHVPHGADWLIMVDQVAGENSWTIESNLKGQNEIRKLTVEYRFNPEHRDRYAKMLVEKAFSELNQIWLQSQQR